MKTEYTSNNSGGNWWLTDKDWYALEKAGWEVRWIKDEPDNIPFLREEGRERWLGALATRASREGLSFKKAVAEWEAITGQYADEIGCRCCGSPHYFSKRD
jgi:hypothetical protein